MDATRWLAVTKIKKRMEADLLRLETIYCRKLAIDPEQHAAEDELARNLGTAIEHAKTILAREP